MHSLVTAVRASVMSSRPWSSSQRLSAATGSSTETHREKTSAPHDRDSLHKPRIDFEIYAFIKASSKSQQSLKLLLGITAMWHVILNFK